METKFERASLPNPGAFSVLTDTFCLVGKDVSRKFYDRLHKNLPAGFPIVPCLVNEVNTVGIYVLANSRCVLLPSVCSELELTHIRNSLPDTVKVARLNELGNCLGNIALMNDKALLLPKSRQLLSDGVESQLRHFLQSTESPNFIVERVDLGEHEHLLGTLGKISNVNGLFAPKLSDETVQNIAEQTKVRAMKGTCNKGDSLIGSSVVMNENLIMLGSLTSDYEIERLKNIV